MKVSKLIKTIISEAEEKFGVSDHINDAITIGIYCDVDLDEGSGWQVKLMRPTQNHLDRGEVTVEHTESVRVVEYETRFRINSPYGLVGALKQLRNKVQEAGDWDDSF